MGIVFQVLFASALFFNVFSAPPTSTNNENPLFQLLSSSSLEWQEIAAQGTVPASMNGHTAVEYNNKMYVYGGCTSKGICSGSLFVLNLV